MAVHDGCGYQLGHSRGFSLALLDFFEGAGAELEARFIFCEKLGDARVEIPANVIELRRESEGPHVVNRFFFEMQKPENYVRDLHACVVDVVLNFDAKAGVAEEAYEGVA